MLILELEVFAVDVYLFVLFSSLCQTRLLQILLWVWYNLTEYVKQKYDFFNLINL